MSARCSPGPWSANDAGQICDARDLVVASDASPVDARLITAAPELLAALKEEHGGYMDEYVGTTGREEHASGCPVCILIAKIEG